MGNVQTIIRCGKCNCVLLDSSKDWTKKKLNNLEKIESDIAIEGNLELGYSKENNTLSAYIVVLCHKCKIPLIKAKVWQVGKNTNALAERIVDIMNLMVPGKLKRQFLIGFERRKNEQKLQGM